MVWVNPQAIGVMLTCADWRLHHTYVELYKRMCRMMQIDGLDVVAVPGPDGLLDPARANEWDTIAGFMKLMAHVHKATALAVVAHETCLRHPVDNEMHAHNVLETAMALKRKIAFEGPVLAVVATHTSDKDWGLKEIGTC